MLDLRERTSQPPTSVFSNDYDFLTGYIFSLTIHLNYEFVLTSIRLPFFFFALCNFDSFITF